MYMKFKIIHLKNLGRRFPLNREDFAFESEWIDKKKRKKKSIESYIIYEHYDTYEK